MSYQKTILKDKVMSIVSERVKKLRKINRESQDQLAQAIDYSKASIANVEQLKSALPLEKAKAIAEHYKTSVDYICGLSDDISSFPTTLNTLCHYISLEIQTISVGDSHQIPVIAIRKNFFEYLNSLSTVQELKQKCVPDKVLDAWIEKITKDFLQSEKDEDTVKYALLSGRDIASDDVLNLLEKAYRESIGDNNTL